ncbi:MAG: DUF4340 domain-containing protein [Phycisphaeraceae bacterium]|nr:DUF4340 domain-containing protein [Phycisphaeraceae bacterium]
MNNKNLAMLAGAAALLCGVAYLVVAKRAPSGPAAATAGQGAPLFPGLASRTGDVARITIRRDQAQATLARDATGAGWLIESRQGFPARAETVRPILSALAGAKIIEAKTALPELYDRLDVGDPLAPGARSTLVTLHAADNSPIASLIVGKREWAQNADPLGIGEGARFYVRPDGRAQSYLVEGALEFQPDPLFFADRVILELPGDKVQGVTITHPDGEQFTVARATPDDARMTLLELPPDRELRDDFAPTRLSQALGYISFDDVAPINDLDWSAGDVIHTQFRCFDGRTIDIRCVAKDGKTWAAFSAAFIPPPADTNPAGEAQPPAANTGADLDAAPPKEEIIDEAARVIRESLRADVERWNTSWSRWAFALPQFKVDAICGTVESLLKPNDPTKVPRVDPEEPGIRFDDDLFLPDLDPDEMPD